MDIEIRAHKIKLLALDVDGVLTTGLISIGRDGEAFKEFYAQDGLGIAVAQRAGLKIAVITGRNSEMVRLRCNELKIADIYQGSMDKVTALTEIMAKYGISPDEVAYVGDDINDLPVLVHVGLACAVANAVKEVKKYAHYITSKKGGRGGVREVIELILKSQGKWEDIVATYAKPGRIETQQ